MGDFPKNVGVFSAYVARFFQPLLDDAMRSLTKLVIFIKSQSGIWVKQTASPHNNSNAKITKNALENQGGKDGVLSMSWKQKKRFHARAYARTYSNFQLFAFTTFTKFSVGRSHSDDYSPIRNEVRQSNRKQR